MPEERVKTPNHHILSSVEKIKTIDDAEAALDKLHGVDGRVHGAYSALFAGFRHVVVLCSWLVKNARESYAEKQKLEDRIRALEEATGINI